MAARKAKAAEEAVVVAFVRVKMPLTLRDNLKLQPGVHAVGEGEVVTPDVAARILAHPKWAAPFVPEEKVAEPEGESGD